MTPKQASQFNRMLAALRRIAKDYQTPKQLRKASEKSYGLEYTESLEYAYENIQQDAKNATAGVAAIKIGASQ